MPVEIERKFLVDLQKWGKLEKPEGILIRQTYLVDDPGKIVRIRVSGQNGYLTIKGRTSGLTKPEYEYQIPVSDASEMIDKFQLNCIEKVRYEVMHEGKCWEVDVFGGKNEGLIIAEIELDDENEEFAVPEWVGSEVSYDSRYINANLLKKPFQTW